MIVIEQVSLYHFLLLLCMYQCDSLSSVMVDIELEKLYLSSFVFTSFLLPVFGLDCFFTFSLPSHSLVFADAGDLARKKSKKVEARFEIKRGKKISHNRLFLLSSKYEIDLITH